MLRENPKPLLIARPSYVSFIPGGPQRFPDDPVGEAYRDRQVTWPRKKRRPRKEEPCPPQ